MNMNTHKITQNTLFKKEKERNKICGNKIFLRTINSNWSFTKNKFLKN